MKKLKKVKWQVVGIGAVIVVILVVGFVFIRNRQRSSQPAPVQQSPEQEAVQMKASDIGLVLIPNKSSTEVEMKIGDVSKFTHFDYEMSYDAIVDGESVPKGAIGSGDINPGDTSVDKKVTLGTCSSGTCKYDLGITKIAFIIRLTLKDGKTGVVNENLNLGGS